MPFVLLCYYEANSWMLHGHCRSKVSDEPVFAHRMSRPVGELIECCVPLMASNQIGGISNR